MTTGLAARETNRETDRETDRLLAAWTEEFGEPVRRGLEVTGTASWA